ncbi:MAG: flagellar hook-associated protein FlgK [Lachnospiraceae bacterium]|nr:flagellar hook-associated protein FlgK [Lachnospiraceae bacterium]
MTLISGLHVGTSGLQTSQNALNATAHNLSNIETKGYVRQQVLQGDRKYNPTGQSAAIGPQQTGLGVEFSKIRQVRDYFLDLSYRKEEGRGSFYDICYETTNELETLLGEMNGAAFQETIDDLWTAVEELQKDPSSSVTQGQFVNVCSQFLDRASAVYDGLASYQDNLNERIKDMVGKINDIGEKICKLNQDILNVELSVESANDLKDQRNQLMDELAKYVQYDYSYTLDGVVEIRIEGETFIARGKGEPFYMGPDIRSGTDPKDNARDSVTGFYTPVWPWADNQPVFDCSQEISTAKNSNIGELKSLMLARGDRRANYTDVSSAYVDPATGKVVDLYNNGSSDKMATANSIVMNSMAELDQLVHKVVTDINNVLTGEKAKIESKENPNNPNRDSESYPSYADPKDRPIELFVRLGSPRYDETTGEYIPEDTTNSPADVSTMYTLANIRINGDLLKQPTLLGYPDSGFLKPDNTVDQTKADGLADAFSTMSLILNPNVTKQSTYKDYYADMLSLVSNSGNVYKSFSEAQALTVDSLDDSRQQIMGANSSEELSNMIKFQNAYNASSRYINAVSEMLEHLISRLGG